MDGWKVYVIGNNSMGAALLKKIAEIFIHSWLLCTNRRTLWRPSLRRTTAPPQWEEPKEGAWMSGWDASWAWCSRNIPMGRIHPEEDPEHTGKTITLFQLALPPFYPLNLQVCVQWATCSIVTNQVQSSNWLSFTWLWFPPTVSNLQCKIPDLL